MAEGVALARDALASGRARARLDDFIAFAKRQKGSAA
jgi:anthranilate phosphoribosyltransferase